MNRLLLDTHAALWWWNGSEELSSTARDAIIHAEEVFFSAISVYEIFQKVRLGRLKVADVILRDIAGVIESERWQPLPISVRAAESAASMLHENRDPFDRMLASQCSELGLRPVSCDDFFREVGLKVVW